MTSQKSTADAAIDYSPVEPNPALGELIAALPGRKHIFTNGDVPHARRTTDRLGITEHFDTRRIYIQKFPFNIAYKNHIL